MSDVPRGVDGKWLPGQSANPSGRPKLSPQVNEMKKLQTESFIRIFFETGQLSMKDLQSRSRDSEITSDEQIILSARINAANGDSRALNIILDRVSGKPMQAIELSGKDGAPLHSDLEGMSDTELELIISKLEKRKKDESQRRERPGD